MHPLEKRREMSGTFPGRIVLAEGDEVDVDLHIAAEKLRLATPFAEIGLWDRDAIHLERNQSGGYELSVADDVVTFYPADMDAFAVAVDEMLDGDEAPEAAVLPPMSLVPTLAEDDRVDERTDFEARYPDVEETEEEPASRFGPSSRERLAAAMSGFRERHGAAQVDDTDIAEAGPGSSARTSSPGFMIPGDEGYIHPADDEPVATHHEIAFVEDLERDTVADQIIESSRTLRGARKLSIDKNKLRKLGIAAVVVAVIAALGFAVPVVIDFFSTPTDTVPATTPQTTVPVTVTQETAPATTEPTVVESTVVDSPLAFDLSPSAFVERWNDTAASVSPNLRFRSSLPSGDFEVGFTAHIAMIGSFSPQTGGISTYTVEIDPTGPSASDRLGIQALGLAIAVADPSLEPRERAAVLAEMGLNVRDPQLGGLNGTTSRNGVTYRLVFDADAVVLRLTISSQS